MGDWKDWPAFGGRADAAMSALTVNRGAYGKAHRTTRDFRWLAASPGFVPSELLTRSLIVGAEDLDNVEIPQLRISERSILAVMLRPARTVDKTGRRTPIEKHMLEWVAQPDVPGMLAAFSLLEAVKQLDDREWFDS